MKNLKFILKIALPLLAICAVCSALLAISNYLTAPVIEENAKEEKAQAINNLLPSSKSFEAKESKVANSLYVVTLEDGEVCYCCDVTSNSKYGGAVNAMVSVGKDGKALDVQIISHSETFISKYLDSNNKYTAIDAISGATYSFNAIRDAKALAEDAVAEYLGGIK